MFTVPFPASAVLWTRMQPFREEGRLLVPAAVSTDWATVATFEVPTNATGYLTHYGVLVHDPTYDYGGSLIFRVVAGDAPIRTLDGFTEQRGSIIQPAETLFRFQPSEILQVQVFRAVAYGFAQDLSVMIGGIYWPAEIQEMFPGSLDNARNRPNPHRR